MRKIAIVAAAAAALLATPAFAQSGEGRAEVRGGIAWSTGVSKAFVGGAVGYDFDIGDKAFIGLEAGADKVLTSGAHVFFTGGARLGLKAGDQGKAYIIGGYGVVEGGGDGAFAGVGYQHKFTKSFYGKIEYRRTLTSGPDVNFAGVGLGVSF